MTTRPRGRGRFLWILLPPMALALLLLLLAPLRPPPADARWALVTDLRGPWRFQLGDDPARARAGFADADWGTVPVPGTWEDAGYWGYDGVAWYRRTFTLRADDLRRPLYLHLGRIDDADQVWVNGHFVGSTGRFPEHEYETAYFAPRVYRIPTAYLRAGANAVAVRVYDAELEGGILDGPVGVFALEGGPDLAVDLAGPWRFLPGDGPAYLRGPTDEWATVTVPARWEPQGFADLDGFAWYRRPFELPERLLEDDLVLVLGKVDDLHEVYLNGERVGGRGDLERRTVRGDEWQAVNVYRLPARLLRGKNDLAVRVYDGLYDGGIYEGPVGIMTERAYADWQRGGRLLDRLRAFLRWG